MSKNAFFDKARDIFGEMPKRPLHLSAERISEDPSFAAGDGILSDGELILEYECGEIRLPYTEVIPVGQVAPVIIYLGFEQGMPNRYLPAEEILDRGYALFSLNLGRVTEANGDFKSGIAGKIARSRRKKNAAGKLMLWAWAAARLVEYVASLGCVDTENMIIAGHGLGAISGMLCAASNERIRYVIANDPFAPFGDGYSSLACEMPYLFCPMYAEKPSECPLSCLLKMCSEKDMLLGSSLGGACAKSEYRKEIMHRFSEPNISCHMRSGGEYFSRRDWNAYFDKLDKIMVRNQDYVNSN